MQFRWLKIILMPYAVRTAAECVVVHGAARYDGTPGQWQETK